MAKGHLSEYISKRMFEVTPEPGASLAAGRSGPPLFVVQQHHAPQLHYDRALRSREAVEVVVAQREAGEGGAKGR